MPSYQLELTDQSPENLAKLKQDHVDIFKTVPDQEYGLEIDMDKIYRYI